MDPQLPTDLFEKIQGADHFRVRCPECFKAYHVEVAEIRESRPRFECSDCHTRFSVLLQQALESEMTVIGFAEPKALVEPSAGDAQSTPSRAAFDDAVYACPKCSHAYRAGEKECERCGVVFLKFAEIQARQKSVEREDSFSASKEVRHLWEDLLNDFENIELHQNFVGAAWADRSLDYAAHKYASILEVAPHNDLARKFQSEIQNLAHVRFEVSREDANEKSFLTGVLGRIRLPIQIRGIRWTNFILMGCGFLIMTGFFVPDMRNLVGFGSAVGFFIFALRYYFRAF